MSLYYDAASIITSPAQSDSSLKSRVYGAKNLKANAAQVYALLSEAAKWNEVLNEVVERSTLLTQERKLTPALAVLLVHDFLLAKKGIAAPVSHALRLAVERHKARLHAEFTKARLRRGCASVEALRLILQSAKNGAASKSDVTGTIAGYAHPRWIRVNRLKSTLDDQLKTTFAGFEQVKSLEQIIDSETETSSKIMHIDVHIPDLIAVPSGIELTSSTAYQKGEIIFQDKASCFPAYLLDPQLDDGDVVDGCAAPGNKTTHLAALMNASKGHSDANRVYACERDKERAMTLQKMVTIAGAQKFVTVQAGQDFLKLDPQSHPWDKVGALLLDPSCSGSGIIGREASASFTLPSMGEPQDSRRPSKKRKKNEKPAQNNVAAQNVPDEVAEEVPDEAEDEQVLQARLKSLSSFQEKIVKHAFTFPSARKVVYSTCSLHDKENEGVVMTVLNSSIVKERGWRILRREEQVYGMQTWESRGRVEACGQESSANNIANACIRCSKYTKDGTQGFFVAAFIRSTDGDQDDAGSEEEEWEGFADGE